MFLDQHTDISRDLQKKPELANDPKYLQDHKDLQTFLDRNPDVHGALHRNHDAVLHPDNFQGRGPVNAQNADETAKQREDRDRFFEKHRNIAADLQANPGLVDDRDYLNRHKDLDAFLRQEPEVRTEYTAYVSVSASASNRAIAVVPDRDTNLTAKQRKDRDDFFDKHKEVAEDLRANPSLVDDHDYLNRHKGLEDFLDKNPEIRSEYAVNLSASANVPNRPNAAVASDQDANLTPKERKDRDDFFDKHKDVAKDLNSNPSLVQDKSYLDHHKDLRAFLDKYPDERQDLRSNPPRNDQDDTKGSLDHDKHQTSKDTNSKQPDTPTTPAEQRENVTPTH